MIYLVRHGETDWNLYKKFNGYTETELNQTGLIQSDILRENLKNISFDMCYSSPQRRAYQTSKIICDGVCILDDRLTEIICGDFEGREETDESFKLFWEACENGSMGTERFSEFVSRNCDFYDMIVNEHKDKNVLIVTHAGNTRILNYCFLGKPNDYDFGKAVSRIGGLTIYENQ